MAEVSKLAQDRDVQIDERIAEHEAYLSNQRMRLLSSVAWTLAPVFIGVFLIALWKINLASNVFSWAGIVLFLIGILAAVSTFARELAGSANARSELSILRARQRALRQFDTAAPLEGGIGSGPESGTDKSTDSYFDSLVRINVENLAAYYGLVKVHTDKSFRVALGVGMAGFALIAVGLGFGFADDASDQAVSYIATGSGVAVEFISGVFFYLYNRTVRQMKEYHDSLLAVQNILLSFKLVGDTKKENEKVKMVAQMLAYLVGNRTELPAVDGEHPADVLSKPPQGSGPSASRAPARRSRRI